MSDQKMIEIVKPNSKFEFIGRAKYFGFISAMLVIAAIILLLVKGLNFGIDFKGGNKLIVAFDVEANATRDQISKTVSDLIQSKTGTPAGQLEVQNFDEDPEGKVVKFQIYSELTTLLTEEQGNTVETELGKLLSIESIDRPKETDKFIIVLKEPAPISATKESVIKTLATLKFPKASITSEAERAMDMEFYKEYNLSAAERRKDAEAQKDSSGDAASDSNDTDLYEAALQAHNNKKRKILVSRTGRTFTVSLQQIQAEVELSLENAFGKDKVVVESATSVSPSVGADLFYKGLVAMLYAIIGVLIYIGLRFDFRYSPGAVVALVHDTLITLGIFSLFGIKFTLPIISALLTIIGYSLNDTIVVYDRIRENLTKFRGMELGKLINQSINETLSRTILTSITTLFVVASLLFLGGGLIVDFAFALTIGVIVGTYSSVFIASPVVLHLDRYLEGRKAQAKQQNRPGASSSATA